MKILETTLEENLDEILRIANLSFENFYPTEKLLEKAKGKKLETYVAEEDGENIGFVIFYGKDPETIYTWLAAVHPNHRRKGVAKKLILDKFPEFVERGYNKVTLKTHGGHPEIINLCKNSGFVEVGRDQDHWRIGLEAIFFEYNLKF